MRSLVTGGAGFIGSHACLRLLDDGHAVTVVDNLFRGHRGAVDALRKAGGDRLTFIETDLADTNALTRALADGKIESVFHFAALTYVGESMERPLDYFTTNTAGGISLLRAMGETGVRRIIFSSTAATYGEPAAEAMPITESTAQRPINPYGASKLQFETVLRAACAAVNDPAPLAANACRRPPKPRDQSPAGND